ncbi:MAG: NUDIX pyrophosphatase [Candidatus Levybacteria bacterium RIFCSPHIGHO2_01_FULL_36_15]|nr:MAG: NUDIX pyrophosphatase [Candidatus Levybacteria bacterium RIFCSPHIGHO2_01_FULL_36_15]OGH37865.1 MAG: NUDIX pyrophosphatase [Candidatus Levybacteria bacterium RIFCSPLOWO2_01_FULL_36_10]
MRSPYQVLIFPFYKQEKDLLFALFKRSEEKVWQGIAGGGEEGEVPFEAAQREVEEEISITPKSKMIQLSSVASIPVIYVSGFIWGKDVLVVPEFSFGVEITSKNLKISHEHSTYKWFTYEKALEKLNWDSNKTALWELNYRILNNKFGNC